MIKLLHSKGYFRVDLLFHTLLDSSISQNPRFSIHKEFNSIVTIYRLICRLANHHLMIVSLDAMNFNSLWIFVKGQ